MDEEDILDVLLEMAEEGKVLGSCPLCSIPLSCIELLASQCNNCGKINKQEILWRRINDVIN